MQTWWQNTSCWHKVRRILLLIYKSCSLFFPFIRTKRPNQEKQTFKATECTLNNKAYHNISKQWAVKDGTTFWDSPSGGVFHWKAALCTSVPGSVSSVCICPNAQNDGARPSNKINHCPSSFICNRLNARAGLSVKKQLLLLKVIQITQWLCLLDQALFIFRYIPDLNLKELCFSCCLMLDITLKDQSIY